MGKEYIIEVTYKCAEVLEAETKEEAFEFVRNKYKECLDVTLEDDEMEVIGEYEFE